LLRSKDVFVLAARTSMPKTEKGTAEIARSSYPSVPLGSNATSRRPALVTKFHSLARPSASAVHSKGSPSGTDSV
jgi:hypothetical protein